MNQDPNEVNNLPTIKNNTIKNCIADGSSYMVDGVHGGGGIGVWYKTTQTQYRHVITMESNQIYNNISYTDGGAIKVKLNLADPDDDASVVSIHNNNIYNNTANNEIGGGVFFYSVNGVAKLEITWNTIMGHEDSEENPVYGGHGVYIEENDDPENDNEKPEFISKITHNLIKFNRTSYKGGGICSKIGTVHIINNTIRNNSVDENGGGIYILSDSNDENVCPIISVNSISYNNADTGPSGTGGGVFLNTANAAEIINNIIYLNSAYSVYNLDYTNTIPDVKYSDVTSTNNYSPWPDPTNIAEDPGYTNLSTDTGHLWIDDSSECYEEGDGDFTTKPRIDYENDDRVIGNEIDIGGDEYDTGT
jgi:hypothetical protein